MNTTNTELDAIKNNLLTTYAEASGSTVDKLKTEITTWDWEEVDRRLWLNKKIANAFFIVLFILFLVLFVAMLYIYIKADNDIPKISGFGMLAFCATFFSVSVNLSKANSKYLLFKLLRNAFQKNNS